MNLLVLDFLLFTNLSNFIGLCDILIYTKCNAVGWCEFLPLKIKVFHRNHIYL